jgi:hypothetical protein
MFGNLKCYENFIQKSREAGHSYPSVSSLAMDDHSMNTHKN